MRLPVKRATAAEELWTLRAEHADAPPLSEEEVNDVLAAMSEHLAGIVAAECAAVRSLGDLARTVRSGSVSK